MDEISQCGIATTIPLLARAQRAVVVGKTQPFLAIAGVGLAPDKNQIRAQGLPGAQTVQFAQSCRSCLTLHSAGGAADDPHAFGGAFKGLATGAANTAASIDQGRTKTAHWHVLTALNPANVTGLLLVWQPVLAALHALASGRFAAGQIACVK